MTRDDETGGLRRRLRGGETVGAFWFALGSPALVEMACEAAPDVMVLDAQHGLWHRPSLEHAIGMVAGRQPVLVRTADASARAIGEALDAGAEGVLVPMIETAGQAADVVAAARFPPHGRRSGGGVRPLKGDFAAYWRRAGECTVVAVMIETAAGLRNAPSIAATPGIDLVLIGTGDLALSLGTFPRPDPAHEDACRAILDACRQAGVPCAIYTSDAAAAAARAAQGYALTVVASDLDIVAGGFRASMSRFRQAGDTAPTASEDG